MPPSPPPQDDTPSPSEPVPFSWWFLTGGTAETYYRRRPPSRAAFLRRASERKAAHCWAQAKAAAAEAEAAARKKAPAGEKPKREEPVARFGPGSGVRASRGLGGILAQRADDIAKELRAAQEPDRAESPVMTVEAPTAQTAAGPEPEEPAAGNTPDEAR